MWRVSKRLTCQVKESLPLSSHPQAEGDISDHLPEPFLRQRKIRAYKSEAICAMSHGLFMTSLLYGCLQWWQSLRAAGIS